MVQEGGYIKLMEYKTKFDLHEIKIEDNRTVYLNEDNFSKFSVACNLL